MSNQNQSEAGRRLGQLAKQSHAPGLSAGEKMEIVCEVAAMALAAGTPETVLWLLEQIDRRERVISHLHCAKRRYVRYPRLFGPI